MYLQCCSQKGRSERVEVSGSQVSDAWWLMRSNAGGVANVWQPSHEEVEQAKLHNERVRRESFNKRDQVLKQKIMETAKDKRSGKSPSREPREST